MIILRASYPNYQLLTPDPPKITEDLDVLEADQPILLDISAIENTDIGDVFGVSSQTFSLPGTDKNNKFFGNLFDLGATPNVAFQKSVDCQVLTDGDEVFTGKMYITDIVTDQKGYTTYQVNVVNETVDLKFKLENLSICDITNLDVYQHTFDYANISSSWNDGLFSGDIVYPHVNYGIPEGNTDLPEYALGTTSADSRKIDNINYPLQLEQFKPAIRVKKVLDALFDQINYKYTSSFLEGDYFNNIYLLTTNDETLGPTTDLGLSFWAYSNVLQSGSAFQTKTINFTNEVYDQGNDFDLGTDLYTAYADGYYNFEVQLEYSIDNFQNFPGNYIDVSLVSSSTALANQTFITPPQANTIFASFQQIYLTAGQTVKVTSEYGSPQTGLTSVINYKTTNTNSTSFKGTGPTSIINNNVIIEKQLPCDVTALEFLQGLVEKFNLVVEPIPGTRNSLKIEPFQDWVDEGEIKDWTNIVDRSQKYKIIHPASEQPKTIYFRDEDDEAAPNVYTQNRRGEVFGTYIREELDSDLVEGERVVGKLFAATPVKGVSDTDMIIPTLATRDDTGQLRPFRFKPRLLYKNGVNIVPSSATGWTADQDCYEYYIENRDPVQASGISYTDCSGTPQTTSVGPDSEITIYAQPTPNRTGPATQILITQVSFASQSRWPGTYFIEDENGTIQQESEYLQMTPFEYLPTDASGSISGSRDLHFGNLDNPGWYQYFQPVQNGRTTRDAYHEYWATYINSLYDIDARKLTCNVFLEPSDIADIRLNDKIFIDGHYYRINAVKGANITQPASVEVELIKQLNRKLKYPLRRIATGSEEPVDITVGSFDASGRVQYIDFVGGTVIDDYSLVSQAATKDGFSVFADTNNSASVTFPPKSPTTAPINRQVFGANEVDFTSDAVMVAGGANRVARQSNNLLLVGENNNLQSGLTNVATIGKENTIELGVENSSVFNSNQNTITTGSFDAVILGGVSHTITSSSLVTIVGGASNEISDSSTSRNAIIAGLNTTVASSQNTIFINGNGETATDMNGNTLLGNFQADSTITGSDFRSGTTIIAGTYLEEDYYTNRNSYQITAYSGSSEAAYSGEGLFKYIYEVDFNAVASGSGVGEIVLPTIVSQEQIGRTILFKASSNIDSGSIVDIVSFGDTDEIEGARSYRLSHPEQWVELRASQYPQGESLVTQWRVLGSSRVSTENVYYGNYYSTGSQVLGSTTASQSIDLTTTRSENGFRLNGGDKIYIEHPGTYKLDVFARFSNNDNQPHDAYLWLKYNDVAWDDSVAQSTIPARKSEGNPSTQLTAISYIGTSQNPDDYVQLFWAGDSTELSLQAYPTGSSPTRPAAPSVSVIISPITG